MKAIKNIFVQPRNFLVLFHDTLMACIALLAAFAMRLGSDFSEQSEMVLSLVMIYGVLAACVYLFTGLYRHLWAYVSFVDGVNIVRTVTIITLLFVLSVFVFTRLEAVPRSVPVIGWFVLAVFLAAPRLTYRLLKEKRISLFLPSEESKDLILLVGADDYAAHFIRATQLNQDGDYRVVGLISSTPSRIGKIMHGVEVLGEPRDIEPILERLREAGCAPTKLVLTKPDSQRDIIRSLLEINKRYDFSLAKLPPATGIRKYDEPNFVPSPIMLEDLLDRPARVLDREAMRSLILGRRILITGAGGSIGSELTQQIANLEPSHVTLLDQGEFNLYSVELDIRKGWPGLSVRPVLADVRDQNRINAVFAAEKPDLVLHAAALKHVPMVEENSIEGIHTNAIGTQVIADACVKNNVAEMVLISTDKAVNPANIMGAGKRLAEIYCQAADMQKLGTKFTTVRFGNVLGSAGSVIPLFQKQLAGGGPLTITHPDIERYFMTIGEAVELVLQAAAVGPKRSAEGSIYVLDMGSPVKIVDLARQLIRLAGKIPDEEINIKFVGLRPGEKLFEELFHGEEPLMPTGMDGVFLSQSRNIDSALVISKFSDLKNACVTQKSVGVFSVLRDLVPEFSGTTSIAKLGASNSKLNHLKVIK